MMFIIKLEIIFLNLLSIFVLSDNLNQIILISINPVYPFFLIPFPFSCSSKPFLFTLFLDCTSLTLDKTHLHPSSLPYRFHTILPTIPSFPPSLQKHPPLPPYYSHLSSFLSFSHRLSYIIYTMKYIFKFLYYKAFFKVFEIFNTSARNYFFRSFPFIFLILFKPFVFTNIPSYIIFIKNCFWFQSRFSSLRNNFFPEQSFSSLTFVKFIFRLNYYNHVSSFFVLDFIFLFIFLYLCLFRLIMFRKNMYSAHLRPNYDKLIVIFFKHLPFLMSLFTLKSFHILIYFLSRSEYNFLMN